MYKFGGQKNLNSGPDTRLVILYSSLVAQEERKVNIIIRVIHMVCLGRGMDRCNWQWTDTSDFS
jgi:hypothetical protein